MVTDIFPIAACLSPSPQGEDFQVSSMLIPPGLCLKHVVSSAVEIYLQVLGGNQGHNFYGGYVVNI